MGKIKNIGRGTSKFGEGVIIEGNAANVDSTDSDYTLVVSGSVKIESGHNGGITFQKTENEINFIRFAAASDGTSYNATLTYQAAEHLFIQPGRGADFYIQARTNISEDPFTFPFRVMDDGTAKFQKGLSDSVTSVADLPSDVAFFVSGSKDGQNSAVFTGDVVVSGSLKDGAGNVYSTGGGGTSKHFATGHCNVTTSHKPVNWINASNISAASGIKSWFIVPFNAVLDKIIVSVKAANFTTANDGNITLSVFKNQANYGSTIVNQTVSADSFSEKVSQLSGGADCNQKIFAGLNQSISEGDLIHVKVGKSVDPDTDREALVTMIFNG